MYMFAMFIVQSFISELTFYGVLHQWGTGFVSLRLFLTFVHTCFLTLLRDLFTHHNKTKPFIQNESFIEEKVTELLTRCSKLATQYKVNEPLTVKETQTNNRTWTCDSVTTCQEGFTKHFSDLTGTECSAATFRAFYTFCKTKQVKFDKIRKQNPKRF